MNLIPVILCGGAGPRLWPVSRELHPKSFIRLAHGQSLLQKAFLRGAELPGIVDILTVTNRELFFKTNVAVVSCAIGLSDIGSWSALGDLAHPDADGNRIEGEALLHDVTHTYIRSGERIGGAVGVDNMTIIDTPDALLVADRSRAQDVKHRYAELKAQGHEAHELHRTVHRPWGT